MTVDDCGGRHGEPLTRTSRNGRVRTFHPPLVVAGRAARQPHLISGKGGKSGFGLAAQGASLLFPAGVRGRALQDRHGHLPERQALVSV